MAQMVIDFEREGKIERDTGAGSLILNGFDDDVINHRKEQFHYIPNRCRLWYPFMNQFELKSLP